MGAIFDASGIQTVNWQQHKWTAIFTSLFFLFLFCQTPVLLGIGVDFTFAWGNKNNDNNDKINPHLNFLNNNTRG